jgi:hypothetical protein
VVPLFWMRMRAGLDDVKPVALAGRADKHGVALAVHRHQVAEARESAAPSGRGERGRGAVERIRCDWHRSVFQSLHPQAASSTPGTAGTASWQSEGSSRDTQPETFHDHGGHEVEVVEEDIAALAAGRGGGRIELDQVNRTVEELTAKPECVW